ncbi:PKD domain-containing protein [Bacteroides sp.]
MKKTIKTKLMRQKYYIGFCLIGILTGLTACLKETPLPVKAVFEHQIEGENQTTPVKVNITNASTGADFYEWTFEGGNPADSREKNPGRVIFSEPGEHRITLRAWNDVKEAVSEVVVRVDSAVNIKFDYEVLVNDFAPAEVRIDNLTRGASNFEWTFEGGTPATSALASPGIVRFTDEGNHRIHLKVNNGSEWFEMEKTIALLPRLASDFAWAPILVDEDMEAPLTATVKNLSKNCLSVRWLCEGGAIKDETANETSIRFTQPGTYTISMLTDNLKEQHTVSKQITVKESCGIHTFKDIRFGINEAKNTIGCFFAADLKKVVLFKEIDTPETGKLIDFGFLAQNSSFGHCYFFSPHRAKEAAFGDIPGAIRTQVRNLPGAGNTPTEEIFDKITKASGMDAFDFTEGSTTDFFALNQLPVFAFFRTEDGRRGIIMIKEAVRNGAASYIVTDIKIEKRKDE